MEALTTFCNVVRKTPRSPPEEQELLNSAGKLGMEHIIPIYRVTLPLFPCLPCSGAEVQCHALWMAVNDALCSRRSASIQRTCACPSSWQDWYRARPPWLHFECPSATKAAAPRQDASIMSALLYS